MYPRTAGKTLLGLMEAGLVKPEWFEISGQFGLDDVNEAVQFAKKTGGPFKTTVVVP
jgi:hypothetical protein